MCTGYVYSCDVTRVRVFGARSSLIPRQTRHLTPSWYSSSKSQLLPGRWLPGRSSWMRIPLTVSVHVEYLEPMKVCARAQSSCSMRREGRCKCTCRYVCRSPCTLCVRVHAACMLRVRVQVRVACACGRACACTCAPHPPPPTPTHAPARRPIGSSCRPSRSPAAPAQG